MQQSHNLVTSFGQFKDIEDPLFIVSIIRKFFFISLRNCWLLTIKIPNKMEFNEVFPLQTHFMNKTIYQFLFHADLII